MTENRAIPPVVPQSTNDLEDEFVCPACGEQPLYNRQEIEEGRLYQITGRDQFSWPDYELARVDWTIYVENWLECGECDWKVEMSSAEAAAILY